MAANSFAFMHDHDATWYSNQRQLNRDEEASGFYSALETLKRGQAAVSPSARSGAGAGPRAAPRGSPSSPPPPVGEEGGSTDMRDLLQAF